MDITKIKKEKYEKKDYIKIYFVNPDTTDLKKLLLSLYSSGGYAKTTYFDPDFSKIQCNGLRRSFEDLLFICNTYFDEISEVDLMNALIEINIKFYRCSNISKIVFHFNGTNYINERNFKDHNKFYYAENTYTPNDLIEILESM